MQQQAKNKITKAREAYFTAHPFDPHKNAIMGQNLDGIPAGFLTLPDMGEMSVVATKYGYELLASVRTDDDIDEWLANVMDTAQTPELTGIMLAHAFRGIAPIIGEIIDRDPDLASAMATVAAAGWGKEF